MNRGRFGMVPRVTVSEWLYTFATAVRARDYDAARVGFVDDVVAFGTVVPSAYTLDQLEAVQWRPVWEVTRDFEFHNIRIDERVDRATVSALWSSTYVADGTLRRGRATILLQHIGRRWRATHTHFSLEPT